MMKRCLWLITLFLTTSCLLGNPASYTGKDMSLDEAIHESDIIIIGKLKSLGDFDMGPPGATIYVDVKIDPSASLIKGTRPKVGFSLILQTFPADIAERKPKEEEKYVFFMKAPVSEKSTESRIIKIMPADRETEEAVVAAVAKPKG